MEGYTELRGEGGVRWREIHLLLSCCPEPSLSAWEPGREAGLISLCSEWWEFFWWQIIFSRGGLNYTCPISFN